MPDFKISIGIGILKNMFHLTAVDLYGNAIFTDTFSVPYSNTSAYYEQIAETYPEVYLSLATILAEEGQMEEAFAYLEEIGPESNWYVASLLVKADLYQMEGLADVAREKLVEAAHLSDDPIIQLGLAEIDLELERNGKMPF